MSVSILFGCSCCLLLLLLLLRLSILVSIIIIDHLRLVRECGLFQSEFYYSIRTDFTDIHCRTIRADGNCVWIFKIAPMIDDLFGIWIDSKTSDRNLWWGWTIHSVDKVLYKMEFRMVLSVLISKVFELNSIYHMRRQRTPVRDLVLESLPLVFLRHVSFSGQPCWTQFIWMNSKWY